MKKKNGFAKVVALIALLAIILGVVGTGLLIIFSPAQSTNQELTPEMLEEMTENYNLENGETSGTGAEEAELDEENLEINGGTFRLHDTPTDVEFPSKDLTENETETEDK